jgi:type IV secretory pathway VirD2 relaxase
MLVTDAMQARLGAPPNHDRDAAEVSLPRALKADGGIRIGMLRRLSSSRLFALGDRSGVLRRAQARSGRTFRLDVRQRVIVKALVCRHIGRGGGRGAALLAHIAYLGRSGAGQEGARATFFDYSSDRVAARDLAPSWAEDRHHFRFIISPEHGDRISDLPAYVREVMRRVGADLGESRLAWIATCHFDTDQAHAHVLLRGRRESGRDLVIPREYVAYGFRARAQEVAHELLGDLSRTDAERRIWRETQADRFTGLDRRLLQAADADREIDDGVGGSTAWQALTRGRLRHLEVLGLATRRGHRFRLDSDLERQLRTLQLRRDIIRTIQQRHLEVGRQPRDLGEDRVRGRVVKTGHFDELGGAPWLIVRDAGGVEHLARLELGRSLPKLGRVVDLVPAVGGVRMLDLGRGAEHMLRGD